MRNNISIAKGRSTGRRASDVIFDASAGAIESRWKRNRLLTMPADRAAAEEGVRMAYHEVGLATPRIIWQDGPVSMAMSWASAPSCAGPSVSDTIVAASYRQAVQRLDMHPCRRVALLRDRFDHDSSCTVTAAMHAAVIESASAVRLSLPRWLHALRSALTNRRWPPGFADSGASQHELCWLGFTTCLLETLKPRSMPRLRGLRLVAENAEWILPHAHVCWLSDRPARLSFDEWGRLHSSSGPALHYRDDWSVYAWKGARVPSWVIDEPQRITVRWIDAQIDPQVRSAMIDIFTPERFVETGGAKRLASDGACTLWGRKWFYWGSVIDSWAAVEFRTQRWGRSFRCVPAHLHTLEQALAWLFGPSQFAGVRHIHRLAHQPTHVRQHPN